MLAGLTINNIIIIWQMAWFILRPFLVFFPFVLSVTQNKIYSVSVCASKNDLLPKNIKKQPYQQQKQNSVKNQTKETMNKQTQNRKKRSKNT